MWEATGKRGTFGLAAKRGTVLKKIETLLGVGTGDGATVRVSKRNEATEAI